MMLVRVVNFVLYISILTSITTVGSLAYGQDEDDQVQIPQVNDDGLQLELVAEGLTDPTTIGFLGDDDMLVLEQKNGTVRRIVNGQLQEEPVLEVPVNGKDERGMLGIAISTSPSNKTYVFLYYTEAQKVRGEPIGNRLYRYEFDYQSNKLINPQQLLDLPYLPGPSHNGGAVSIGPDNNVYVAIGELIPTKYGGHDYDTKAQNYEAGKEPDGRAGIIRVSQDGEIVQPPILGDEHPLDMYYAYGIRNSFGIDFDPLTGNLWDTENGPFRGGDEVNLVEPGFNSGWARVSGINEVIEEIEVDSASKEENRKITKGEEILSVPEGLVDFNGKGRYSPPELSGGFIPTEILFLNSSTLGEEYKDDVFIATVTGNIYHFDLNEDRTELILEVSLSDEIEVDETDLEAALFAQGFGIITDIEEGPDGFMYVVSGIREDNAKVYRIDPALRDSL